MQPAIGELRDDVRQSIAMPRAVFRFFDRREHCQCLRAQALGVIEAQELVDRGRFWRCQKCRRFRLGGSLDGCGHAPTVIHPAN